MDFPNVIDVKQIVMYTLIGATLLDVIFWSVVGYVMYCFNRDLHDTQWKN